MKTKIYKIAIPAAIVVLVIGVAASFAAHPMAQAHGGFMHHKGPGFHGMMIHDVPKIEGTLPAGGSIKDSIGTVKVDALVAGAIAANSVEDGKILGGGILPTQEYLVHHFVVSGNENLYKVIVDAGNGEILYTSKGISLTELDAKFAEMKEKFGEKGFPYGKYPPMMKKW